MDPGVPERSLFIDRIGRSVVMRPVEPGDAAAVRAFFHGLSKRSLRMRFLAAVSDIDPDLLERTTHGDFTESGAYVILDVSSGALGGLVQYVRDAPGSAEVALAIEDTFQHEGLGTQALVLLAQRARQVGISQFTALVLSENTDMLDVFRDSGFPSTRSFRGPLEFITLDISHVPGIHPWECA